MAANQNRYKTMVHALAVALCVDALLFIVYLISAGSGILWLKSLMIVFCILVSCAILALLYLNRELTKRRSLWISTGAFAILVCLLFSLILNFPSPSPFKQTETEKSAYSVEYER